MISSKQSMAIKKIVISLLPFLISSSLSLLLAQSSHGNTVQCNTVSSTDHSMQGTNNPEPNSSDDEAHSPNRRSLYRRF